MSTFTQFETSERVEWVSATVGAIEDQVAKVFVIRTLNAGLYFADWSWDRKNRQPAFKLVGHLSCARPFMNSVLCASFLDFLGEHDCPSEMLEVFRGRLVRPVLLSQRQQS